MNTKTNDRPYLGLYSIEKSRVFLLAEGEFLVVSLIQKLPAPGLEILKKSI